MKRKILSIICCLAFCSVGNSAELDNAILKLSQKIGKEYASSGRKRLAVVPFTEIEGEQTKLGRLLSEKLITALHNSKRFKIVERSQIEKVLEKLKLGTSGLLNLNNA